MLPGDTILTHFSYRTAVISTDVHCLLRPSVSLGSLYTSRLTDVETVNVKFSLLNYTCWVNFTSARPRPYTKITVLKPVRVLSSLTLKSRVNRKFLSYWFKCLWMPYVGIFWMLLAFHKRWIISWPAEILTTKQANSVASVCERTISTERPPLINEVSANFCR
jgi:hypothetical protein